MAKYIILGAGFTGLSTAYHLKKDYFLAEKSTKIGGLGGSIEKNGFIFDYAEHFLRLPNKEIQDFFQNLMKGNIFSQELNSTIYFKNKYISYPIQNNLRELPPKVLKRYAEDLILNHFKKDKNIKNFKNFEEYLIYQYGETITQEFMIPYNTKIWSIKPCEMNTSWFLNSNVIPSFSFNQILDSILPLDDNSKNIKNIRWYPLKGGSQAFANAFLPYLSHIALKHKAIQIDLNQKEVHFQNGHTEAYDYLISTIPIIELLSIIDPIPEEIKQLIILLRYNSVYCMNLCLDVEIKQKNHWIYFPQEEIPFSRLFFSGNFSKYNTPKGKSSCSALVTFLPETNFNIQKFENLALETLSNLGIIKNESEIIEKIPLTIKYGFTLPTLGLNESLHKIFSFLESFQIHSIGRYGEWKYSGIEHAISDGQNIVNKVKGV